MTRSFVPIVSFTAGEWSPRLAGRIDIAKYQNACKTLKNMIIWPHGGATRRPGFEYIGQAKETEVRLIKFQYNTEQTYIIELGNQYMRFYRDGGQLVDGSQVPREIVTPYLTEELQDIGFTQSGDIMYLVHHNHPPQKLSRTGVDEFSIDPVSFTAQPAEWTANNYPNIVTFYQQRTVWTGCPNNPQTLWFSVSLSYENITPGTSDSSGIRLTLASDEVNAIKWVLPASEILIGTTGGEWIIGGGGSNEVLTPLNVRAQKQSKHGSVKQNPLLIGNSGVYISRNKEKVREMRYDLNIDAFASPELSLLAEHITRKKVKELYHIYTPDSVIWCLLESGELAGCTYLKDQEVIAWHQHETSGTIKSICTLEDDEGSELWLAVERTNGTFIERMHPPFNGDTSEDIACNYVDSGLSYEGTPVTEILGLDHLEGEEVSILADGARTPNQTVAGGKITLTKAASKIIVGLKYEWALTPMSVEGGNPTGLSQSKRKRIVKISARLERSLGVKYKTENTNETELINRDSSQPLGTPSKLISGDREMQFHGDWNKLGEFTLFGDDLYPVNIIAIVIQLVQNE